MTLRNVAKVFALANGHPQPDEYVEKVLAAEKVIENEALALAPEAPPAPPPAEQPSS